MFLQVISNIKADRGDTMARLIDLRELFLLSLSQSSDGLGLGPLVVNKGSEGRSTAATVGGSEIGAQRCRDGR